MKMGATLHLSEDGKFIVNDIDQLSYVYFPMTNYQAMKSCITPLMGGSATTDQNTFMLVPSTNEDYHNSFLNRNMYFRVNDNYTWSITGNTPYQMLNRDQVDMEGDFLSHSVTRTNEMFSCRTDSFVPFTGQYQELHRITIKNISKQDITLKPVINIPLYSRSADNLRDHRHVTALLNKAELFENGIINQPTFSFDERGHMLNKINYGVFVHHEEGLRVVRYWPVLEEFIGEGGNLLDPFVLKKNVVNDYRIGDIVSGYETIGGFEFDEVTLKPNQDSHFYISLMMSEDREQIISEGNNLSEQRFSGLLEDTKNKWRKELDSLQFSFSDATYNGWLKWVTLQPILRRIYGNSFLPHHDYGRGGRGWRDLWQDSLALILMNPKSVREMLLNNFNGVRIDGSNATIIGNKPGEFLADRNHIARVWMDHGSWPLITTMLYVDKSGDYQFLLEQQKYFQDHFTHYTKKVNPLLTNQDNVLKVKGGDDYKGTVIEHLIIQNLVPFYNIGEHNNIRIEGADWNDALDMASKKGESVAFTALYANNLIVIARTLRKLFDKGIKSLELFEEMKSLLSVIEFENIELKKSRLSHYFDVVSNGISGQTISFSTLELAKILETMGSDLSEHIRDNEWMQNGTSAWFNGYYDGDGQRLESIEKKHMTLTGQVFPIYAEVATDSQIEKIVENVDRNLFDLQVGGYKLNTDFKEVKLNMGRLFGFAYGHKENGAMFSHMSIMYANALYKRGFVKAGDKVIDNIFRHCVDINTSKMYPGIPEYIDPKGRGMYPYLTGSASWLILTLVNEVFGIKGDFGDIVLEPKLLKKQFDNENRAEVSTLINGVLTRVVYDNPDQKEFGEYSIQSVRADGESLEFSRTKYGIRLLSQTTAKEIYVELR